MSQADPERGEGRPTPWYARRPRWWLVALSLGSIGLLVSLGADAAVRVLIVTLLTITAGDMKDACQEAIVARMPSPDGAWEAKVDETACLYGFGVGAVVAGVHLVSTRDPARTADLLGVDTGGHEDERPRLAWTAPDVLQVTVYDHSFLKVLTRRFDGVRVDLRYDPDDPADRAAWRREHGISPEP